MSINSQSWFTLEQVCELLHITPKTVKNRCYKGDFIYKIQLKNNVKQFFIHSSSVKLKKISEIDDKKYSDAPKWSKIQAEKYIKIVKKCLNIKGKELQEFISNWNNDNPDLATSYSSVIRMRSRYIQCGISGLLAKYGNNCGKCIIDDNDFEYFKNLYLKEGAPSLQSCWDLTLGYAMRNKNIEASDFPSCSTFKRKLKREIPKQSIYLARYGQSAWNRKYNNYIERDYSNIICGKVWVSDHAQIDVACLSPDGDIVFPWVTA